MNAHNKALRTERVVKLGRTPEEAKQKAIACIPSDRVKLDFLITKVNGL
jgi:hypothetical protein